MPITTLAHQIEDAIQRLGHVPSLGSSSSSPPLLVVHAERSDDVPGHESVHRAEPALAALRTSSVPVLYAPQYDGRSSGSLRIFAPVDFQRGTEPLLAWIRDLAGTLPAEVVLGTVVKSPRATGELAALVEDAERALAVHARNAGFGSELVGVRVIEGDKVAEQLLEQARQDGCDLIVMATHGKDAIARYFVGSTTESLLKLADRPVLILRRAPR